MLVSFNSYNSINRNQRQSPNFKSLQNGIIEASEVAKYASNAQKCGSYIHVGAYKPTVGNLKALFEAKDIANKNVSARVEILSELDDSIAILIKKAKEQGQQAYDALKELIQKAKDQGIDLNT